jgi:hypothetical protein
MNFEKSKLLSQEEKELMKNRILSDAELLRSGAEIRDTGSLEVSREQAGLARREMREDLARNKVSDRESLSGVRAKIRESTYKYKDPERLLDSNYNLDDLSEGSHRKWELLKMREYYNNVRKNIETSSPMELTVEEKKLAKSIDGLPISDSDKVDMMLVWRKLKPATDLHIDDPGNPLVWWWMKRKIGKVLDRMGMHYADAFYKEHSDRTIALSPDISTFDVMVSERQRYMDYLEGKHNNPDLRHRIDYEKAGMFYGFPKTAITAYVEDHLEGVPKKESERNRIEFKDLPKNIQRVAEFVYSRGNWEEEAKTSIRWAEEIVVLSPKLYKRRYSKIEPTK